MPTSIRLTVLHDIIQAVMGWCDYHLWEFNIDRRKYGLAMDEDWGGTPRSLGSHVRLRDVLKPGRTVIDYTYDFGDCWEHRLTVTDVRAGQPGVSYPALRRRRKKRTARRLRRHIGLLRMAYRTCRPQTRRPC